MRLDPIANDYLHALDNARNVVLQQLNDALGHLRMVSRHADGIKDSTPGASAPTASLKPRKPKPDEDGPDTTTERAALVRYNVGLQIEELREYVHAFHGLNRDLLDVVRAAWGHEQQIAEKANPVCCDGQHGKEGSIEWGDPTCMQPPVKAGMCQAHYMGWYRHRKRNGIDTSRDFAA